MNVAGQLTIQNVQHITLTRYVNAAAFVVRSEINLIWSARFTSAKGMFLFIRYMVPVILTIYTIQLSGLSSIQLSDVVSSCRWWMSIAVFMGWTTLAISNFLILLRLWVVWDCGISGSITLGLANAASVVLYVFALILILFAASLFWNQPLHMCGFHPHNTPPMAILWVPGTLFEIFLFCITWWNALTRPRSSNAPLAAAIYRDVFLYFLVRLRITNTVLAFTAPKDLIFIAMFPVWCATTTTTCRLVIKLRQISEDHIDPDVDMSPVANGDYDELVRSGVHVEMLRSIGPSTPIRASTWY
ncbi:hypothetical protein FB451DRAFT_1212052 [Mycena latifolia]|nr:hypothetical protein FB451DRAFT_1212052 [Mycena latifolia]